jgi:predicted transposase YbfD/YdcC
MESTTCVQQLAVPASAPPPDPTSLYIALSTVRDRRKRRGRRYPLALGLTLLVLGKLAGETTMTGIAHWARLRTGWLAAVFRLPRPQVPCANTYTLVCANVDLAELNAVVARCFQPAARATPPPTVAPARGSHHLAVDGKTLRGTRCGGATPHAALHQLGLYDITHQVMLAQRPVASHDHEIPGAADLLTGRDLRGCVVTADALHTQRAFCAQVVRQGGDYLLLVKGNQAQLRQDIAFLFADPWPPYLERPSTTTVDKGHGRLEVRRRHASAELNALAGEQWVGLQHVFQVEREVLRQGKLSQEVVGGITSLPRGVTPPRRLLAISRAHWQLENGRPWRRDVTLGEDACRVRTGQAPHVLAALNNVVLTLMDHLEVRNVPAQMRTFCAQPSAALRLLLGGS